MHGMVGYEIVAASGRGAWGTENDEFDDVGFRILAAVLFKAKIHRHLFIDAAIYL